MHEQNSEHAGEIAQPQSSSDPKDPSDPVGPRERGADSDSLEEENPNKQQRGYGGVERQGDVVFLRQSRPPKEVSYEEFAAEIPTSFVMYIEQCSSLAARHQTATTSLIAAIKLVLKYKELDPKLFSIHFEKGNADIKNYFLVSAPAPISDWLAKAAMNIYITTEAGVHYELLTASSARAMAPQAPKKASIQVGDNKAFLHLGGKIDPPLLAETIAKHVGPKLADLNLSLVFCDRVPQANGGGFVLGKYIVGFSVDEKFEPKHLGRPKALIITIEGNEYPISFTKQFHANFNLCTLCYKFVSGQNVYNSNLMCMCGGKKPELTGQEFRQRKDAWAARNEERAADAAQNNPFARATRSGSRPH
jgi:hypothetical protein